MIMIMIMINILSWTTKKDEKTLSRPLHSKLKKIQGLFKEKLDSRSFNPVLRSIKCNETKTEEYLRLQQIEF